MRNTLIDKEYNEKLNELIESLEEGNEVDIRIAIVLKKSIIANPEKVGKGPEAEYRCPDCGSDLIGYIHWRDDRFCKVCGKRIKKPKKPQTIDYNFYH